MNPPFTDLQGAYAWLDSQVNYELKLDQIAYDHRVFELDAFRARLAALGDPHRGPRTIHIAGTRGKGSAALILETLLRASGLSTATFISPHLREYRERIRINGQPIAAVEFTRGLARVAAAGSRHPSDPPVFKTVFEDLTALFFLAARDCRADWVILETGLGGRLDATNVVDPGPVLLTRIGLEHTHLLGDTIAAIAAEKAAILKPGGWGILGAQDEDGEAFRVFENRSRQTRSPLTLAAAICPLRQVRPGAAGLRLELELENEPLRLDLPIYGTFQAENIQNALGMAAALRARDLIPRAPRVRLSEALSDLRIPGRMEPVCARPLVFADGAHCPTGARALAAAMRQHFGDREAGLIVGMMADKDHAGFFAELARWNGWRWVGCYTAPSRRALEAEALAHIACRHFCNVRSFKNLEQALQSLSEITDKIDVVVAAGSLYSIASLQDWGRGHDRAFKPEIQDQAQA